MNLWPHQQYALAEIPKRIDAGSMKLCLTSPTGGGKSKIICGLIEWALTRGWYAILYTNRRLLIDQLDRVLHQHGIERGVRAAGHKDQRHLPVQISSLPTERVRTLGERNQWDLHGANTNRKVLAIIDEAHLNKSDTACTILGMHHERGHPYIGVTATPIDLGHLYDELIVAGTPSELRKCGALVPAYHYGPDEPDMTKFKANIKTGEYTEGDVRKAIMTKAILGRVIENYQRINEDRRPSILFGPGVAESIWFAEQLSKAGIKAAHIDGAGYWINGEYVRTQNHDERNAILKDLRLGRIDVLCNRFVAREGIDLPEVSHCIFATVMGSLQSYLQSGGRVLRSAVGKDRATIQDHGGHWWRHGSVNQDREWSLTVTENMIAGTRADHFREKKEQEPICCPNCHAVRYGGAICHQCGYQSTKRSRMVIEQSGAIKEHTGDIFKPRAVKMKPNTLQLWQRMYYRAKHSKNQMTFRQAEGLFAHENYYWPPRDLPLMPVNELDWFRSVASVPLERLSS